MDKTKEEYKKIWLFIDSEGYSPFSQIGAGIVSYLIAKYSAASEKRVDELTEENKEVNSMAITVIDHKNIKIKELEEENNRLKGLIKDAHISGRNYERTEGQSKSWNEFKKENNIE